MPSYATPDDFREIIPEFDLTGTDDGVLQARLDRASELVDTEVQRSFEPTQYTEMHEWKQSRSVYLFNWPVISVDSARFVLGDNITATIPGGWVINNSAHYIELATMALATNLAPDVLTYGLVVPQIEITYTAGSDTPNYVRIATCLIALSQLILADWTAQGITGMRSVTIGSYTVTLARGGGRPLGADDGEGWGNYMPPEAKAYLKRGKFTSLR